MGLSSHRPTGQWSRRETLSTSEVWKNGMSWPLTCHFQNSILYLTSHRNFAAMYFSGALIRCINTLKTMFINTLQLLTWMEIAELHVPNFAILFSTHETRLMGLRDGEKSLSYVENTCGRSDRIPQCAGWITYWVCLCGRVYRFFCARHYFFLYVRLSDAHTVWPRAKFIMA